MELGGDEWLASSDEAICFEQENEEWDGEFDEQSSQ